MSGGHYRGDRHRSSPRTQLETPPLRPTRRISERLAPLFDQRGGFVREPLTPFCDRRIGTKRLAYSFDQRLCIPTKLRVAHLDGVATHEWLYGIRQLVCFWYSCPIDHNGDHTNVSCKGRRDFNRNIVFRIVEPAVAALILQFKPMGADDGEKYIACGHLAV